MLFHPLRIIRNKFRISVNNLNHITRRSIYREHLCQCKNICWDMSNYYAVAKGRKPGIYTTWAACQEQVLKFSGCVYKKFNTIEEAEKFIKKHGSVTPLFTSTNPSIPEKSQHMPDEVFPLGNKNSKVAPSVQKSGKISKRTLSSESYENDTLLAEALKRRKVDIDVPKSTTTSQTFQNMKFTTDDEGYVQVFTDGACSSNGARDAIAGIGVWFGDNHPLNISRPVIGRPTNNNAEIQAVTAAVREAKKAGIKKLKINTDSKFLIQCVTQWMKTWKRNGWKTASGKPVINKEELLELEQALTSVNVAWNHVRGHVGIHGNEMADKLARHGCASYIEANQ